MSKNSPQVSSNNPAVDLEKIPLIDIGPYLAGAPDALGMAAAELRLALEKIGF